MWSYKKWMKEALLRIAKDAGFSNYDIDVFDEQDFTNDIALKPNYIIVTIKKLSATKIFNSTSQPVQINILSEENGLEVASIIFKIFASEKNYTMTKDDNRVIKHIYKDPAVLKNFLPVGTGYRSLLYVSATLIIIDNILDIEPNSFKIDGKEINYITLDKGYNTSMDTQPMSGDAFPTSIAQFATTSLVLTIPAMQNDFVKKCLNVDSGSLSEDTIFNISYEIFGVQYNLNMKMSSFNFSTSITDIPSIKVGFTL